MVTFEATIKETSGAILHPTYMVSDEEAKYLTDQFFVDFWGLNNPDVEEWSIKRINDK